MEMLVVAGCDELPEGGLALNIDELEIVEGVTGLDTVLRRDVGLTELVGLVDVTREGMKESLVVKDTEALDPVDVVPDDTMLAERAEERILKLELLNDEVAVEPKDAVLELALEPELRLLERETEGCEADVDEIVLVGVEERDGEILADEKDLPAVDMTEDVLEFELCKVRDVVVLFVKNDAVSV